MDNDSGGDPYDNILPFAADRKGGEGMPVVFTEIGYLPYNRTGVTPQNSSGSIDTDEQIMVFNGLLNALDGRADVLPEIDIWQWWMPGSDGSKWNIDPTAPANQPNNIPLGQFLSDFVSNPVFPILLGDANNDGQVTGTDLIAVQQNFGNTGDTDGLLLGDANDDGQVTGADLIAVQQNFGNTLAPTPTPVPEPTGLVLLGLASAALLSRKRLETFHTPPVFGPQTRR